MAIPWYIKNKQYDNTIVFERYSKKNNGTYKNHSNTMVFCYKSC